MTYVFCGNEKCKHNKDGGCTRDSIMVSDQENCMDVEYDE